MFVKTIKIKKKNNNNNNNLKRKIFYYKKIIMRKIREEYVTTEVFVEGTFRKHINNNGSFWD